MYRYDEFDHSFVKARVAEFSDQVERRLAGEITEEQFRPLFGGKHNVGRRHCQLRIIVYLTEMGENHQS